jgi:DNA (cytosine-5)-methyltransferase 1
VRLLDLFCCQGGASAGYVDAGFDVLGVDIDPQPRYPFEFVQADALEYLADYGHGFDMIHASPPCQAHSRAQRIMQREHPDFIAGVRDVCIALGKHYVIENVVGAPLHDPVLLCGAMFGIETYRHRLFEASFPIVAPTHPEHTHKTTKMGRRPKHDEFMHVVGNFSGVSRARDVMGMPWANRDGLREAIPPIYAQYIGEQVLAHVA